MMTDDHRTGGLHTGRERSARLTMLGPGTGIPAGTGILIGTEIFIGAGTMTGTEPLIGTGHGGIVIRTPITPHGGRAANGAPLARRCYHRTSGGAVRGSG